MTAKLITYLDEYKMYSISSQLFEGLTQDIVQYSERRREDHEEQKGPLASGRLLADIVSETTGKTERRFLFDYAYTIFEQRLLDDERVFVLNETSSSEQLSALGKKSFVSISGRLRLNDLATVQSTTKSFNETMAALTYVSSFEYRKALMAALRDELARSQGKQRQEVERRLRAVQSQTSDAAMDPEFLKQLVYVLEVGFGDHLEAQINLSQYETRPETLFTAVLDRTALRESGSTLVKKYSRRSEQPFTIFGIVTQHSRIGDWNMSQAHGTDAVADLLDGSAPDDATTNQSHLKIAISRMTEQIGNIEDTFFGRLSNEVIVDPIAIYRSL